MRLLVLAGAAAAMAAAFAVRAQDQAADFGGLPEGKGREFVHAFCGACHSVRLVAQQGLSRQRWDHLLDWMREEQGMPALDAERRELVLDYLSRHLGEERDAGGGQRPATGITLTPLPGAGGN